MLTKRKVSMTNNMPNLANTTDNLPDPNLNEILKFDQKTNDSKGILSDDDEAIVEKIINHQEHPERNGNELSIDAFRNSTSDMNDDTRSPQDIGETSVSGSIPDLESDDDMLENSHEVGLRLDEDEDNPQELNIAADVEAAEKLHRER